MKLCRIVSVCALILFACAGLAQANTLHDPGIRIGGHNSAIFFTPGHTSVSLTFNTDPLCTASTSNLLGGSLPSMICGVINQTNAPLKGFNFNFGNNPQALQLFSKTGLGTWTSNANGTFATFLFATPLANGGDIRIEFVGFNPGQTFSVSQVPEPATLTLLASGLGALFMRRRARQKIA